MEEFNALDKLGEVCGIFDGLAVEYEVHRRDEGEFSYLDEGEVSLKIPNPYTDRTMFIDFQYEISLFFGEMWHLHFNPYEDEYVIFVGMLNGILKNEQGIAELFAVEPPEWLASIIAAKDEINGNVTDLFFKPKGFKHCKKEVKKCGGEVRFIFWNPVDDLNIVIEKKAKL